MTFQAAIPQPSDLISVSQADILNNFTSVNTAWNVNHQGFNAVDAGKHKFVTLPEQSAGPATAIDDLALYSKAVSAVSELFLRKESSGTEIQMSSGVATIAAAGSTFLPGGIILNWGTGVASTGGTVNTFTRAFPTACWGVVMSIQSTTVSSLHSVWCTQTPPGQSSFTAKSDSSTLGIFYIAIGN